MALEIPGQYTMSLIQQDDIPYCLVVRIPGSHPGGPGSIPGMGRKSF